MANKTLITIVGATAIGKTALGLSLANFFNTCILSCDSRQFYKEIPIGTGAPTQAERQQIPHYFIHHKSIEEDYSVGDFEREATKKLQNLFKKYPIIIMVGGSGLYVEAVLKGLDYFPKIDKNIRTILQKDFIEKGLLPLQKRLKILDKITYQNIDIQNPQRVLRALEVCIGTGQKFSSFKNRKKKQRDFASIKIGLNAPREVIYQRIEDRVNNMFEKGLLQEAKNVYAFKNANALQTVGYKELFAYFEGKISLKEAVEEIKKNTRRFAKRQLTWFSKDTQIHWFNYLEDLENIKTFLQKKIES